MKRRINRAAVIGAGTMGAAIAAHLANAGIPVFLLDITPERLTPAEESKGLSLSDRVVRNRVVNQGLERVKKASPPAFFTPDQAQLVTPGNLEDDLGWVGQADWIVEAVVENLAVKRQLMARIEAVRGREAIVSSNTSGIPIGAIAKGRAADFKAHFLGTHFFNPPRYLKLLELVPTPDTDPEVVAFMTLFAERSLGKGVVICHDRPNFIANRLAAMGSAFALGYALDNGYGVEEIDAITGPLIGHPKTATFRLADLVGLDVMRDVSSNLYPAIAEDPHRPVLRAPKIIALLDEMVKAGSLGNKSGRGFYKAATNERGEREFWSLDLATRRYEPPRAVQFESVAKAQRIDELSERLRLLMAGEDRASRYLWATTSWSLAYAAGCVPEIADDVVAIDNAVKWGFAHELGPFETWDALGVAETARRMEAGGLAVAGWVKDMLANDCPSFYQRDGSRAVGYYDQTRGTYRPLPARPNVIVLNEARAEGKAIKKNLSASLIDIGDDVGCLEFHSKMNALDPDIVEMIGLALEEARRGLAGLVIGNQGEQFCVGANILNLAIAAQQGAWGLLEQGVKAMQDALMALRQSPLPVVAAPFGMALGGGAEVSMAAARVCASAELYMGQVEMGVGLIPAAGGCKELLRRVVSPPMKTPGVSPLPFLQRVFELIALAKVSGSAAEAREMGFLTDADRIVMSRDRQLSEAKRMVLELCDAGYRPPAAVANVYVAGRQALAALEIVVHQMEAGRLVSAHDAKIARKLAYVLCGGDLTEGQWVGEQYLLDLEREAFLSLLGEPKTLERIWHMLQTGKPLRN